MTMSAATTQGMTLIETMVAMVIVALLAAAIGGASGVILGTEREADESSVATELGMALLEEITALPFDDPAGSASLGPDLGEWGPPTDRSLFDDVDDYTVWDGSYPLQQKDGTAIDLPGYTRDVTIQYVGSGLATMSMTPTDYKQITVRVYKQGTLVGTFGSVRVEGGRYVDFDG